MENNNNKFKKMGVGLVKIMENGGRAVYKSL